MSKFGSLCMGMMIHDYLDHLQDQENKRFSIFPAWCFFLDSLPLRKVDQGKALTAGQPTAETTLKAQSAERKYHGKYFFEPGKGNAAESR